jgi:antirestriction protein ArdC
MESLAVKPVVRHNISRCYYAPAEDYISLPGIEDFDLPEEYYSSLFHELIHWTGHPRRLNRFQSIDESDSYSFEELVAEIGSAYLCGLACVSPKILDNQAAYINGWLHKLSDDKDFFIKAAMKSQEAVNFIIQKKTHLWQ